MDGGQPAPMRVASPGDFDGELTTIDPRDVTVVETASRGKVTIIVSVEGEDVKRLEPIAQAQGKQPGDVVADLLRKAELVG
jgi:hypothetical protein